MVRRLIYFVWATIATFVTICGFSRCATADLTGVGSWVIWKWPPHIDEGPGPEQVGHYEICVAIDDQPHNCFRAMEIRPDERVSTQIRCPPGKSHFMYAKAYKNNGEWHSTSIALSTTLHCWPHFAGDDNQLGMVDIGRIMAKIIWQWGGSGDADLDGDGTVGMGDISMVRRTAAAVYGQAISDEGLVE